MTTSTQATVVIPDASKAAAISELGDGFFSVPLSTSGAEPATHWMSSGHFLDAELNRVVNDVAWSRRVYFGGDWQAAIDAENLKPIAE